MQIDVATRADDELYEAFQRLVPQLTSNNPPPTQGELVALIQEPSSTLLLARADDGGIVGALNLTVYRVPTGVRSIIEDVIVDTSARGRGVGQALMKRAIELAKEKGAKISRSHPTPRAPPRTGCMSNWGLRSAKPTPTN